jgi:hypothetical protein
MSREGAPIVKSGSPDARKQAALVLEVLGGARTIADASEAMGISTNRYYQLERRALDGLIAALEPRKRGRIVRSVDRVAHLESDKARLEREIGRLQALLRGAQRAIGITPPAKPDGSKLRGKSGKTRRRSKARGKRVVLSLRRSADGGASAPETGPAARPSGPKEATS